jgi:hypothetical protein
LHHLIIPNTAIFTLTFAQRGRFNFTLEQGLLRALTDPEVKRKLLQVAKAPTIAFLCKSCLCFMFSAAPWTCL